MRMRKIISIFMAMVVMFGCFAFKEAAIASATDKNTQNIVGAPTQKTWTFEAKKSGTYKIVFTYARPWEKDDSDSKTVTYTVKVSGEKNTDSTVVTLAADKENVIKQGEKFAVTLEQNPSTGYEWNYDNKDNGITFINAETEPMVEEPMVGTPVNRVWTFKASKRGTFKLVFKYARPWEKGSSDSKTVKYEIKVANKKCLTSKAVRLVEGKVNTICKNQKFFITLEENASTGYSWSYKTNSKTIKLINKK